MNRRWVSAGWQTEGKNYGRKIGGRKISEAGYLEVPYAWVISDSDNAYEQEQLSKLKA